MQAIILAAGMGKRLKELTQNNTKCMVKVNGVPLIQRCLSQLDELGLSRIVIVVGYEAENLKQYIKTLQVKTPVVYVENSIYDKTNNIYSLYLAKEYLKEDDALLLESDMIFEDEVLKKILRDKHPNLALVDKYQSWMDGTCLQIDEHNGILGVFDKKHFRFADVSNYYKTVNIYKFSKEFSEHYYLPFLGAYINALGNNEYYEQILKVIVMLENSNIKALPLEGELWYEIDDIQDLDIAESMFANSPSEKLSKIYSRYGGYWRYPKLLDFCYLVNPYYPPQKLLEEIQASFTQLVINYPSGQRVNSLIAAKNFGLKEDYVVVGNGAAELINEAMAIFNGKIGLVRPSFEEYVNRCEKDNVVEFKALQYNADDIINFFNDKEIKTLVLVNPDNPSGNFIEMSGLLRILKWSKKQNLNIIIDESFVDFAETEEPATLLKQNLLDEYKNLAVIKSISKSYGVPGFRLGILASGNKELMEKMKKSVSIWNINSFAEFYLQICEKYANDYSSALQKFYCERKRFAKKLSENKNLKIYPSQANYFMVELLNGLNARKLCEKLLNDNQILIKDLSNKNGVQGEFVRIAIKTEQENDALVEAIKLWIE